MQRGSTHMLYPEGYSDHGAPGTGAQRGCRSTKCVGCSEALRLTPLVAVLQLSGHHPTELSGEGGRVAGLGQRPTKSSIVCLGSDSRHRLSRYLHHRTAVDPIGLFRCRFLMQKKAYLQLRSCLDRRTGRNRPGAPTEGGRVRKGVPRDNNRHHGRPAAAWDYGDRITVTVYKIGVRACNSLKMAKGRRAHGPDRARGCAGPPASCHPAW